MNGSHGAVSRRDLQCLEALYDAHAERPGDVDALAVLEGAGLTFSEAQRWAADARVRGLIVELDGSLIPADEPTREGRAIVEDARRRRTDRGYLRRVAIARLLAWTDATGGGNVTAFLQSDHAWIDGAVLTLDQAAEAATTLNDDGLVNAKILGSFQADVVRVDVTITSLGRDVIDEYGGDVAAWRAASKASAGQSVHIGVNSGAVAFGGAGATVSATVQGFDAAALAQLVSVLEQGRDAIGLAQADVEEYDANLQELGTGDTGRTRRALEWFGRLGRDIGANALGGVLAAQALALLAS